VLDVHFVLVGAAIGVFGQGLYLRDTLRGTTQPNRVTFLLWGTAPLLAFAVEVSSGVGLRSLATLVFGVGPLAIFVASFANRASVWRIGRLDYACGAVSILGTAGWLLTRHGTIALAAAVGADAMAAVPTIVKAWADPGTESASVYVCGTANAAITLLTVRQATLAVVAFPAYIVVAGSLLVVLVVGRAGPRWRARRRRDSGSLV
jgi:hypothetical protein